MPSIHKYWRNDIPLVQFKAINVFCRCTYTVYALGAVRFVYTCNFAPQIGLLQLKRNHCKFSQLGSFSTSFTHCMVHVYNVTIASLCLSTCTSRLN